MRGRRDIQGWITANAEIGNFGENHALRASVALGGLGALEPIEAMYFVRYSDDAGQALDGRRSYLLTVPPQGIASDSFWSFTMYELTPDGKRRLVENPIGRCSVGDRTRRHRARCRWHYPHPAAAPAASRWSAAHEPAARACRAVPDRIARLPAARGTARGPCSHADGGKARRVSLSATGSLRKKRSTSAPLLEKAAGRVAHPVRS